jgi:RND family efflux transporter MFP subunit
VVKNPQKEADLASVLLSEKAEQRLGVRTAQVEQRTVSRSRTVGGELVVPPGQALTVAAPVAGTVLGGMIPAAGSSVRRGQVVMRLAALPAATEVAASAARLKAARKRTERAAQLLKDGAGSQRALDDAEAEQAVVEAQAEAARPRFGQGFPEGALAIESPQAGFLRDVFAGVGQPVAAGAPLFQVEASSTLWVRVPIYVGDLAAIERGAPAQVRGLGTEGEQLVAQPVAAPPSANADAASTDLYFKLDNAAGALRRGQKVAVGLVLRGGEASLVVPASAIVRDYHGGTWVYENRTPHLYQRRRVEVRHQVGDEVVLARGPAPGTRVVTVAAAELFGTEFGAGK